MNPNSINFLANQIIEEGVYKNNRKAGVWKEYYTNGNQKNELIFEDGRPKGKAIMFYENGCLHEEGTWKNNHWTGLYKEYSETGELLKEIQLTDKGKREGPIHHYPEFFKH